MTTTRAPFEGDLGRLREQILNMGTIADQMLDLAIRAVVEQDPALTKQVITTDDQVDAADLEIEMECLRLIALQQPVARDLRLIGTAIKAIADLERLGDFAVDIAKIGRRLAKRGFYRPLVDLPGLAALVRAMLSDALSAFVTGDLELVHKVIAADDAVDDLYHHQRDHLISLMESDSSNVYVATFLLLASKYLERSADHVVNIAERVYYMETGHLVQLATEHSDTAGGAA